MCRSIKTLRPPYVDEATPEDVIGRRAAIRAQDRRHAQAVGRNQQAFDEAVEEIAAATAHLLGHLQVRVTPPRRDAGAVRELSPK